MPTRRNSGRLSSGEYPLELLLSMRLVGLAVVLAASET